MTEIKANANVEALLETAISDKDVRSQEGHPFLVMHDNMGVTSLEHLLKRPLRTKAAEEFSNPAAFSDYVKEFATDDTRMFAMRERGSSADKVEAVVDYHQPKGKASWRDHKASLTLRKSVDWLKWMKADAQAVSHAGLIDFLTDYRNELIKFTAVDEKTGAFEERSVTANIVLDMLRKMKVSRKADQDSTIGSGEFSQMVSKEERLLADGKPWPAILTVALPVYDDMARWELNFRLTVLEEGRGIRITLIRPELVEQAAFDQACGAIIDATGVGIFGYKGLTANTTEPAPTEPRKRNRKKAGEEETTQAPAEEATAPAAEEPAAPEAAAEQPAPMPATVEQAAPAPQAEEAEAAAPVPAPWAKPAA